MARAASRKTALKARDALQKVQKELDEEEVMKSSSEDEECECCANGPHALYELTSATCLRHSRPCAAEEAGEVFTFNHREEERPNSSWSSPFRPSEAVLIRSMQGTMSGFMRLPLETVTQICESVDLKTLFHLSTLNRRFFRFLRDDSLSHLWEDARKTSELPDFEVPMPPHQLAHLLFGSHCSVRRLLGWFDAFADAQSHAGLRQEHNCRRLLSTHQGLQVVLGESVSPSR